jgi:hypothetical protein
MVTGDVRPGGWGKKECKRRFMYNRNYYRYFGIAFLRKIGGYGPYRHRSTERNMYATSRSCTADGARRWVRHGGIESLFDGGLNTMDVFDYRRAVK